MDREFLFMFGYEDPVERASNLEHGTDFESSGAVRIVAPDKGSALEWGREVAQRFVATLYEGVPMDWKSGNFASWIEEKPDEYLRLQLNRIPVVRIGEYPPSEMVAATASE